jgi:hypothetical protein
MSQADELESVVSYLYAYINWVEETLAPKFKRLDEITAKGGFLSPATLEAAHLRNITTDLRKLADRVDMRRQLLEGNARERVAL